MSDRLPVSAHMLTYQSGATLPAALDSVARCTEIIVVDGGSTDDTLAIARKHAAKILDQGMRGPIADFARVRNIPLQETTQPWVLVLDSDETASPELIEEIARITADPASPHGAWRVPRRYVLSTGERIDFATTYPNERIYFFHRDAVQGWIKPVHERVVLTPGTPVLRMRGPSLAPLPRIEEFKAKNRTYIGIEAANATSSLWQWTTRRLLRTLRSRAIATIKLAWIWLLPHRGKRLPLRHELLRFWYAWALLVATFPLKKKQGHSTKSV